MAEIGQQQNADGLLVLYPRGIINRIGDLNVPKSTLMFGKHHELEVSLDFSKMTAGAVNFTDDLNNDGTLDGWDTGMAAIPANAAVLSAQFHSTLTATGGTSFVVGTYQVDGTTIVANDLITATEGVIANMTAGKLIIGAGAKICTSSSAQGPTQTSYVGVTPTGTFTAGTGKLIIRYIAV